MALPNHVTTREVSIGGAYLLESGTAVSVELTVAASKSLIWSADGFRYERSNTSVKSAAGAPATLLLPVTDQAGWLDEASGDLLDVTAEGSYTHRYAGLLVVRDADGTVITKKAVGPFVLPAGEEPVDLDLLINPGLQPADQVYVPDSWYGIVAEAESWAAASLVQAQAAEQARVQAGQSAFSAGGSAAAAQGSEDAAKGFRDQAAGQVTLAKAQADASDLSRVASEAAANLALTGQFAGQLAPTIGYDWKTLQTPGIYRFTTTAYNASSNTPRSGLGAGILMVLNVANGVVEQQYYPSSGQGCWLGTLNAGSGNQVWKHVPYMRVDNPAGQPGFTPWLFDGEGNREVSVMPTSIALGSANLNDVTVPGTYRQDNAGSGTVARNYPVTNFGGVVEVIQVSDTRLLQRATVIHSGAGPRYGIYQRRLFDGTWGSWVFIASQRVDQTAGRAIYTWDDQNAREQLIYGDTGIRELSAQLLNSWIATNFRLRRIGSVVELLVVGLDAAAATNASVQTLPAGFRPAVSIPLIGRPSATASPPPYGSVSSAGNVSLPQAASYATTSLIAQWSTVDAWPSTLPGTPVGSIPNL